MPEVTRQLWQQQGGKMFAVLVVRDAANALGYLAGFSGMLNRQWQQPGFVPPLFNVEEQNALLASGERQLDELNRQIDQRMQDQGRLDALQYINDLERQKQQWLAEIKLRHQQNKKSRHAKRDALVEDNPELLAQLSLHSQADKREARQQRKAWDEKIAQARQRLSQDFDNEILRLKKKRRLLSRKLHKQVFDGYQLVNAAGEQRNITTLFNHKLPPGGAGDCAAPRLIQYANVNKLQPLALAEFWWGAPAQKEVRHHGQFYPPCRGKCHPILPFMLQGVSVDKSDTHADQAVLEPRVVYEDEHLLVLNKPAGLLSVPGKGPEGSVQSWLRQRYPDNAEVLLVHRLDMATSGLLLAAKNARAHKNLQRQFIHRKIKKRYVALLSRPIENKKFSINLPLRVDLDDRPRQLVCFEHGKQAMTQGRVVSVNDHGSRVYFYPLTGRTHQLRVHAAHHLGLNAPIVGDALYGEKSDRLLLHAEYIRFNHPLTSLEMAFNVEAPF